MINLPTASSPEGVVETLRIESSLEAISERGKARNEQLERYFRQKAKESHDAFLSSVGLDFSSLDAYRQSAADLRERLLDNLGVAKLWKERSEEIKADTEHLGDLAPGRLYQVQVWVLDEVAMPALLLVPQEAEKTPKPVVICQHGYSGSPEWVMGFSTTGQQNYLNAVGHRLASAGYVVLAPMIVCSPPGVGKDRVRLDRLARLAGMSLLGFEMFELSRVIDWLQKRPEVLPNRIGMYGISQGGKTTLFLAALDERVSVAICSCYFNNRWNKMLEDDYLMEVSQQEGITYSSYLVTDQDDKFNMLAAPLWPDHLLGALICPRPFMVEIGRYDPVIYWKDAVEEFGRLRAIYQRLGIADRTQAVVAHWGGHEIFYDDAKKFLDRWLLGK